MRAHGIKDYASILQVLSEPGCPICTFLKNVQSKLLQEGEIEHLKVLCNAHAWALAAVRRTSAAARIFLSLVEEGLQREHRECSACIRLAQEETLRMQELLVSLGRRQVSMWIDTKGVLCLPHGLSMREQAPEGAHRLIDKVLDRRRSELEEALHKFIKEDENTEIQQGGALGKAAEYLVAQRGVGLRLRFASAPLSTIRKSGA